MSISPIFPLDWLWQRRPALPFSHAHVHLYSIWVQALEISKHSPLSSEYSLRLSSACGCVILCCVSGTFGSRSSFAASSWCCNAVLESNFTEHEEDSLSQRSSRRSGRVMLWLCAGEQHAEHSALSTASSFPDRLLLIKIYNLLGK